ncbi:MAG: alpha-L-arabinofuranosidase [Lachnospiraceae bacterium]|nr:alpha-L-arabinofuranosidase [Lachnospiraceae bacterium]
MKKTIKIYEDVKADISPEMTGLFFEDINYAADGGLYAEMLENRHFEFYKASGHMSDFYIEHDNLYAWEKYGDCEMKIVMASPVASENPHYLRFKAKQAGAGFTNKAYDGICVKKSHKYNISFYCRNLSRFDNLTISLLTENKNSESLNSENSIKNNIENNNNNTDSCNDCNGCNDCNNIVEKPFSITVSLDKSDYNELCPWVLYKCSFIANRDIRHAKLLVTLPFPGIAEFDFFSMLPDDAVAGIFRRDLFELLNDLKPGFIRFPGGCIVEGATLENRYKFKDTLKPLTNRKNNWNRWAVHGNDVWTDGKPKNHSIYDHYNQTYGIGFYEFFLLCDLLKAKPLPVLNVGLACQYQSYELVEPESEEFDSFIQDALDLIEFANGPTNSKWGKVRKDLGHEAPFNLELLGIGNEQWETDKTKFFDRYSRFEMAIHAKYPDIKLIGSAGPDTTSDKYEASWNYIRKNFETNKNFAYAVDEHYYVPPKWLFEHNDFYDNYDRNIKVFAGEYAAHPAGSMSFNNPKLNTLEGALAEAAFLTGVERNADVVVLSSYAPLFARLNFAQWSPDMIWFDDEKAYGTPSYYVQCAYSNLTGNVVLDTKKQHEELIKSKIYYNPSKDEKTGTIYVKLVNAGSETIDFTFNDTNDNALAISDIYTLTHDSVDAHNSIENPDKVFLEHTKISNSKSIKISPFSFNVIVI